MARIVYVPELGRSFSFKDGASDQDVSTYLRSAFPMAQEAAPPAPPPVSDVGAWESAGLGWLSRFQTAGGGISEMLGQPEYAKYFYDKAQANLNEAAKYQPEEQSILGAETWGGSASALGEAAIQSAPDLAGGLLASAGTGAAAGSLAGPVGAGIGALIGGGLYAFGSSLGSNIQRQAQEQGTDLQAADEATAATAAALQAPLEAIADRILLGRLLPEGATLQIARRIVGDGVVKHAIKGAGAEGLTEAAQQAIELGQANPEKLFEFSPDVQRELADAAIAGGFLGGVAGGILDPAGNYLAGRKDRQLKRDLAAEQQQAGAELSQGRIAQSADELVKAGVRGEVSIEEVKDPAGFTKFTLKDKVGQPIADFDSIDAAARAIDLYKRKSGVDVNVRAKGAEPAGPEGPIMPPGPKVPLRVGKTKFPDIAALQEARKKHLDEIAKINIYKGNGELLVKQAAANGVTPIVYAQTLDNELTKNKVALKKYDDYIASLSSQEAPITTPTVSAPVAPPVAPTVEAPEVAAEPEGIAALESNVPAEAVAPEPITDYPIGVAEAPVTDEAVPDRAVIEEEPAAPVEPLPEMKPLRQEMRTTATDEQLTDLKKGLFGQPLNVRQMTPEQLSQYEAERDRRFPQEPVDIYYSGSPTIAAPTLKMAQVTGPNVKDYSPETQAWIKGVYTKLQSRLSGIVPKQAEVRLQTLIDRGPGYLIRGQASTEPSPDGIKSIIDLSTGILKPDMTVEDAVKVLVETLNHEIIHVIRQQGVIRPEEWRILSRAAMNTKVPGKKYTYLDKAEAIYTPNGVPMSEAYADPDAVVEEAVAEMYKNWVKERNAPAQTRGLFNRITEFFRRIFRSIRDTRYETVFQDIESGEVGAREGKPTERTELFSAAPTSQDEFNSWFKASKIVDENGKPLTVYHGTAEVFDEFKHDQPGKKDLGWLGRGFYFTSSPILAKEYAMLKPGTSENILPVNLSIQNPYIATTADKNALRRAIEDGDTLAPQRFSEDLMAKGHDGVILDFNRPDKLREYVVFDPTQVKSIFNQFAEGAATSTKFSAAPLPPYVQQQNSTLFAPTPKVSFKDMMFNFAFGSRPIGKTLNTQQGAVDLSTAKMAGLTARSAAVDKGAYIEELEKQLNKQTTGNFQRMVADYSATAALAWRRRATHLLASMMLRGKMNVNFARPGDIQSATMQVVDDPDSMKNIFDILLQPGAINPTTGKPDDKRDIFKSYAVAKRGEWLAATGQTVPREITPQYIRETIPFVQREYPEVVEAYNMYQRFNKNLLTAAKDAGLISAAELSRLTSQMNYYGFIYEVYGEPLGPSTAQKTASKFKLRPYTGTQYGGMTADPMFVMIQNANFWVESMAKNLAAVKSFKLAELMGEARLLGSTEDPDPSRGEENDVMYFSENGQVKKFAVRDPLLVVALGSDDRIDVGRFWEIMGIPTRILRESVTRDPGFMVANLMRDTLSTWITSGADITPFLGTLKGMKNALKGEASFKTLGSYGAVGSYDLAMLGPADLAATLRQKSMPKNIHTVGTVGMGTAALGSLWNRLGAVSEASDAATRIAVYEAAKAKGLSDAEAALQAIEILDFTRRGGSQTLGILTKIIPFLNARIQGMDVLYQAGRAGIRYATGRSMGERDANLGKKFLVRGAMLAAISMALEYMNDDDEDYEQLDDYIKNGNLLIPLSPFGLDNEFIAIPKPFEAGLLFSTIPQQFYKSFTGDATSRENIALFTSQLASTFGVNPIPQVLLPAYEVITNHDFYTGLPLISEGKMRLAPELQYNASTSQVAMILGKLPIKYNFDSGKFEGISPIVIENLISGYGGPLGTYLVQATGIAMEGVDIGPERIPQDITRLPAVKRFFIDAETKNPKVVSQAYELFRLADEANRSFSRLRQTGDAEAVADYLDENRDILAYKKYIFKMADRLNKLSAQERVIERDQTMTDEEKLEAVRKLREVSMRIAAKVSEINRVLGR